MCGHGNRISISDLNPNKLYIFGKVIGLGMSSNELCIACRGFEQNSLWYTETSCCASPTEKCRSKWRKPALKVPKHKSKHTYLFVILSFFLCPWSYLLGAPCSLNCLDRRLHPPRHWCHDFREFVSHQQ